MEIKVRDNVFSTCDWFINRNCFKPKSGTVDMSGKLKHPRNEEFIYGFDFSERRVSADWKDPSKLIINLDEVGNEEKILNVHYRTRPFCGKAEYEGWCTGYIILPKKESE